MTWKMAEVKLNQLPKKERNIKLQNGDIKWIREDVQWIKRNKASKKRYTRTLMARKITITGENY